MSSATHRKKIGAPAESLALDRAISDYERLLFDKHLESTMRGLEAGIKNHNLIWKGRSHCDTLRPFFITEARYQNALEAARKISIALDTIAKKLAADDMLFSLLELPPVLGVEAMVDRHIKGLALVERIDGFFDRHGVIRFVEINDRPGGMASGDSLEDIFDAMPIMRHFREKFEIRTASRVSLFARAIRKAKRAGRGPGVAFLNNEEINFEANRLVERLNAESIDTYAIRSFDELTYRSNLVRLRGKPIDFLAVPDVALYEIARRDRWHPLLECIARGGVRIVNGSANSILKSSRIAFAYLSDDSYRHWFAPEIRRAIETHVPWTRRVRNERVTYKKKSVDLIDFAFTNREQLVLKECGSSGGAGVTLGWRTSLSGWGRALRKAMTGQYILQERVHLPMQRFPIVTARGRAKIVDRYYDTNPYVWNGSTAEGCLVRASSDPLLNVSARGSELPVYIISK